MSSRRESLRSYLLEVTRDLLSRGVIRKQNGQTLEQILKAESKEVLMSAAEDLKAIGGEMFSGLISGAIMGMLSGGGSRH